MSGDLHAQRESQRRLIMTSNSADNTHDQGADRSADRKPREVSGDLIERTAIAIAIATNCGFTLGDNGERGLCDDPRACELQCETCNCRIGAQAALATQDARIEELDQENARLELALAKDRDETFINVCAQRDAARARIKELEEAREGHGEPCYYCGENCNSLAGSPNKWPIPLCHVDDPGRVKWHHVGCVSARLVDAPQSLIDKARAQAIEECAKHHDEQAHICRMAIEAKFPSENRAFEQSVLARAHEHSAKVFRRMKERALSASPKATP